MSRVALPLLCLLVPLLPAGGQVSLTAPSEWTFRNAQGGYCISYLVSPTEAAKLAPKEAELAPAGRGEGLYPSLARVVQDEAEFSRWIPARLCVGLWEEVVVDGRVVGTMKPDKPIVIVTHTLQATSYQGAPVREVLLGWYTDHSGVSRAADQAGQRIGRVTRGMVAGRRGADSITTISVDGIKLIWQGRRGVDSSVATTHSVSFGYTGQRGNAWIGELREDGGVSRLQYGGLSIEGGNARAKALRASPDRAIGPVRVGGEGRLSLRRSTPGGG